MGLLRRWGARDPKRVVMWFGVMTPLAIGVVAVEAVLGNTVVLGAGALALAALIVEGVVYLPRAWRTMRGTQSPRTEA
jgi:hypothetical protein